MSVWVMIILFIAAGIGAIIAGAILFRTDRLGGYVGIVGGLALAIFALYPLYGNFYTCEYEPVGDGYYTEKCERWEP